MAASVWELSQQQLVIGGSEAPQADGVYVVTNAANYAEAFEAVVAAAGGALAGLPAHSLRLTEVGGGTWVASVAYKVGSGATGYGFGSPTSLAPGTPGPPGPPPHPEAGTALGPEWSFDTAGATQHVKLSRKTRHRSAKDTLPTGSAPNFGRAVNVTKDGVEGVDIIVPKLELTLNLRPNYITREWINLLYWYTGRVNDRTFLGYRKGEVLCLGASGQSQTPTDGTTPAWTVTIKWAVAPTRGTPSGTDATPVEQKLQLSEDPLLYVPGAEGWDYVWVSYTQTVDGGRTVSQPCYAYVERMYPYANFDDLGLYEPPLTTSSPPPPAWAEP